MNLPPKDYLAGPLAGRVEVLNSRTARVALTTALLLAAPALARITPASKPAPPTPPATLKDAANTWHDNLKDAYAEASKAKRPVLVIVGAEWCPPCKALAAEMEKPDVAKALGRWTLVHLDLDTSDAAPGMLQGGGIPVLRVLAPTGRRVDVREGGMAGEALVAWLDATYDRAVAAAAAELLGDAAPDADALPKLVTLLAEPEAAVSEAAVKRLRPHPGAAAGAVVGAFAKGNLATRLACLELLAEWKAPVADLDPWQPDTVTNDRLKALIEWSVRATSQGAATRPTTRPTALGPQDLDAARQQIARMVAAPSDEDARAIRERLARLGKPLLPEVAQQLRDAATDAARERLLALRYRLAATDALVLGWPGGIERLASGSAAARRAAAEELVGRATEADGPLLLELFADADALVREISLRGLRAAGKGDAARALLRLLADPDLNVRAAVLKELAEAPSAAMLQAVIDFADKEPDPDLVVHAARVLRESKAEPAVAGLTALLGHANWRVRAEAAEGLNELVGSRGSLSHGGGLPADVFKSMVKLLDDPDSFVVSRAVLALSSSDSSAAVEPLVNAATKHPELAGDIIRGLTSGEKTKGAAERHLRTFCANKDPGVRGQAIAALCTVTGEVEQEMKALLKDESPAVRTRAAAALFNLFSSWRPEGGTRVKQSRGFLGFGRSTTVEKIDTAQWANDFRGGTGRAKWTTELNPDLEAIMRLPDPEAQLEAALAHLTLNPPERGVEVLTAAARARPPLATRAAHALPWLSTAPRVALFKLLVTLDPRREALGQVAQQMAILSDPAAGDAMWDLLSPASADLALVQTVYTSLIHLYLGERYYDVSSAAPDAVRAAVDSAKARAAAGPEFQRLTALAVLVGVSPDAAVEAGNAVRADAAAPPALRADALQAVLLSSPKPAGVKAAVAALGEKDPAAASIALRYLATGGEHLRQFRDTVYVNNANREISFGHSYSSSSTPILLEPPPGLTADQVRPLLKSALPGDAANAGYLLALLGDRDGLDPVVRAWRASPDQDDVRKLAYRAVAALKDERDVPTLEEIYASYKSDRYEVREFYWTIRGLTGEKVLVLRKKIRDQVGMDSLR